MKHSLHSNINFLNKKRLFRTLLLGSLFLLVTAEVVGKPNSTISGDVQHKSFNLNSEPLNKYKEISISKNNLPPAIFKNAIRIRELTINPIIQNTELIRINDTIILDLFSKKQYKAYIDRINTDINGTVTIRARLVDYNYGYCMISTYKGKSFITIDIHDNKELFISRFDHRINKYYLQEIDRSGLEILEGAPSLIPPIDNKLQNNSQNKKREEQKDFESNQNSILNNQSISNNPIVLNDENNQDIITLMIVYTPSASAWASTYEGDINNTIGLLLSKAQLVLDNSNTLLTIQLVHSEQVSYTELNNVDDLNNLKGTDDGYMDNVHSLRDYYLADLVVLLEEIDYTGGQGYLLSTISGSPAYAFSLTRVQQASWTYTTIHEIGHNLGCHHHKLQNVQPGPGLYDYSAGWRWTGSDDGHYCSVMTYPDGKYFEDGITHERVPYFSNPGILYKGITTGDATNGDNARTIRQTKSVVSGYRTHPITAPIVATAGVTYITQTSAQSGGNITSDGGLPIVSRGVCWGVDVNPTVDLSTKTSDGIETGEYTSAISGLTAGTTYHVRAYASNSNETGYGEDIIFTTAEHFVAAWWQTNGLDHMNLYALAATLDGTALQPGDEIGVFDGDVCVGVGVLTEVLTGSNYLQCIVSLDDPGTPEKDGYTMGNAITFKVWDTSANIEVGNVQAEFISGEGIFTQGATATFNLTAQNIVEQQITLLTNWNILSFAVLPENLSMRTIVDPLIIGGILIKVQDEQGNAIERLADPIGWIDNIGQLSITEGYKIKVTENSLLIITGQPITLPYDIPLDKGWNIIGAPALSSQEALPLFEPLITDGSLIKVQDEQGNAIERLPDPIGWIDNIHTIDPGKGYKVKTSVSTSLTINSAGKKEFENLETPAIQPSHFISVYTAYGLDHMNIYIDKPTVGGIDLKTGDEIGVFDGSYCVGAVVIDDPSCEYLQVHVSFDDPTTREIDGFREGNMFELRLWDTQTGLEKKTQSLEIFKGYTNRFEKLGTSIIKVDFEMISNSFLGDAYPNPSSGMTTFTFQLMSECKVNLEIFNIMGNLVNILVNEVMPAGTHKVEWDNRSASGNEVPSGVYFYRIRMDGFTQTKQLVVK
jgi:hypothetical protein